jgi:hypothetical protein
VPGATSFPQPILTATSFNASLFRAIGQVSVSQSCHVLFGFHCQRKYAIFLRLLHRAALRFLSLVFP